MENIYNRFLECTGVSTDTRTLQQDELFFCLKGENFNGNKFAKDAIAKGAKYAVIDEREYELPGKTILVDNVLKTLQNLANYHRRKFSIPVIGITGSNGKTTTKELIAHLLSQHFKVLFTNGNLNNHIGVPLTLLRLKKEYEIAIIEMGANHPGDIQELCDIAEPNYGIITNIGKAHLAGFKNIEGVIETKTALYRSVEKVSGTLFVNADDSILMKVIPAISKIEYSAQSSSNATIHGELIELTPLIHLKWNSVTYSSEALSTKIIGEYNFYNLLAAISIANYFEVPVTKINQGVESYSNENNRSQLKITAKNQLIMDAYNANPSSMSSAINSFDKVSHSNKLMILGDMFELGDESQIEHQKIVDLVREKQLTTYFVGERFYACRGEFEQQQFFQTKNAAIQRLKSQSPIDALILLKGSRGMALESLVDFL